VADESIWKKEISFGRKRKEPAAETEQTQDAPATSDESTSVWKKEISFGRKKKERAPEPEAVAEQPVVEAAPEVEAPVEETPTWTRAVSFGRKSEPEVATEPQPVAEPESQPVAEAEPVHEAPAIVEAAAEEASPEPQQETWTRAVSFSRKSEPEAAAEPAQEESEVVEAVASEAPTETWSAKPTLPPEPAPGVHAPVTADELPPLETEKKVPFWKKDISFGGGDKKPKKQKAPKAERAPKAPKEKKPKQEKQPRERKPKEPKVKAERGSRGAKKITGLKVGASQLAAARVANNGSAELLQVARTSLEPGIVVGGELRDPDALAAALKQFFAANSLPKKGVRLGIANNRIGVRTFEIAGIDDEKQLTNAIRFRAQEALPIPIDEAVLDYQVLGDGVGEDGQPTKRILLVVAYRELIDRYVDACRKAGIQLTGIDLEAFALLRALQAPRDGTADDPGAALVAVAIGHDRSTFAVSDGRTCEFTRVLEWGGSALNVAIARALDAAPSEVDGVKRALALTDEMVPEGLSADQAKKARDAMRRAIQTFARELVSSLQYYQNQPGSLGIGEIVLTGGTAHLHGLAGELERLIGVRVRVGDPLARMKVSKKVGEAEQIGSLAVAIGLGIED
jgi:type IV pilus assembly protein PilM